MRKKESPLTPGPSPPADSYFANDTRFEAGGEGSLVLTINKRERAYFGCRHPPSVTHYDLRIATEEGS